MKTRHPLEELAKYLPPDTFLPVAAYLKQYKVHLTIARERQSILGDYRHAHHHHNHRISVNGNLNTYAFLITLLHELAHLLTFEKYGNRVQSHGREWKSLYGSLLGQFIQQKIFPADIEYELLATLHNPGASSCAEESLVRVLKKYDAKKEGHHLIENIPHSGLFRMKDGKVFRKLERIRKRYKCEDVQSGKLYLFSPVYEAEIVDENSLPQLLHKVVREKKEGHALVEELPANTLFRWKDGRIFRKGEKLRTRFKCEEIKTKKFFLFKPMYEVEVLE